MRNNAAYLPENPIVYIIFPESIHNRASFTIFVWKEDRKVKTTNEYLTKIRQFKQQFAEKYGIISIGIFGSVARGEQHEESDLDVFVELKDPDPFIMFDIKEELERICNCKIDLLRLHKNLRSLISQRIARDGIYA